MKNIFNFISFIFFFFFSCSLYSEKVISYLSCFFWCVCHFQYRRVAVIVLWYNIRLAKVVHNKSVFHLTFQFTVSLKKLHQRQHRSNKQINKQRWYVDDKAAAGLAKTKCEIVLCVPSMLGCSVCAFFSINKLHNICINHCVGKLLPLTCSSSEMRRIENTYKWTEKDIWVFCWSRYLSVLFTFSWKPFLNATPFVSCAFALAGHGEV